MATPAPNSAVIRFGPYETDVRTGELRKHGMRIKLQEQPFQILLMLLEKPGELVTREEILHRLWPGDTFVDFEHGVNTAIRRLREALNDEADNPRWVETLPRRGYRFIGQVDRAHADSPQRPTVVGLTEMMSQAGGIRGWPQAPPAELSPVEHPHPSPTPRERVRQALLSRRALVIAVLLVIAAFAAWRLWPKPQKIDSIAVLPFANESKDPDLDYLTEGIAETIIGNLAEIPSLRVTSRNSAFSYKGRVIDPKAVARELGVRAVLVGTVRAAAPVSAENREFNDLHLGIELVNGRDNRRLWGEQYEIKRLQLNEVQADISDHVTERLELSISPAVRSRLRSHQTENSAAFDAYLRGTFAVHQRANDILRQALNYFQEAVDRDPNYARAYAGISAACGLLAFYGGMVPAEAFRCEQPAIDHALQLDPQLAEAHSGRGFLLQVFHRDMPAAEREFGLGVRLRPYSGDAHHALALHLAIMNRSEEAVAEARRAAELEPMWPGSYGTMIWVSYFLHRFADMPGLLSTTPTGRYHELRAVVAEATGRYPEAVSEGEQSKWFVGALFSLPHLYAVAGRPADARNFLDELLAARKTRYVSAYQIALIYAGLGDSTQMLQWLNQAEQEMDPWVLWLRQDPRFDPYRSLPELAAIERRAFTPR